MIEHIHYHNFRLNINCPYQIRASFHPNQSVYWGQMVPGDLYTPTELQIGIYQFDKIQGINSALVAHEAYHAAYHLVAGDWRTWAPKWDIPHKKEETTAWVVERITSAVLSKAQALKIPIMHHMRPVKGVTL